jgi:disulfide bond formation protein DsbB
MSRSTGTRARPRFLTEQIALMAFAEFPLHWLAEPRRRRRAAFGAAAAALLLVAAAVALTEWLQLNPCPLCILQRALDLALAALLFSAGTLVASRAARWPLAAALLIASGGIAVAGYQSWIQLSPPQLSCGPAAQGVIELIVAWLGERMPLLFLATGSCESTELSILGLTLANWSLLAYLAFAALIATLLRAQQRAHPAPLDTTRRRASL